MEPRPVRTDTRPTLQLSRKRDLLPCDTQTKVKLTDLRMEPLQLMRRNERSTRNSSLDTSVQCLNLSWFEISGFKPRSWTLLTRKQLRKKLNVLKPCTLRILRSKRKKMLKLARIVSNKSRTSAWCRVNLVVRQLVTIRARRRRVASVRHQTSTRHSLEPASHKSVPDSLSCEIALPWRQLRLRITLSATQLMDSRNRLVESRDWRVAG